MPLDGIEGGLVVGVAVAGGVFLLNIFHFDGVGVLEQPSEQPRLAATVNAKMPGAN
jgi:hypothetical protein